MLLALALLSAFADQAPAALQRASPLERLVLECDQVVLGKIIAVHDFSPAERTPTTAGDPVLAAPPIHVLEIRVLKVYWGDPSTTSAYLLDDGSSVALQRHGPLEKGEESFWFLESDPEPTRFDEPMRRRIVTLAGKSGLQVAALGGRGRVRVEDRASWPVVCLEEETWILPKSLAPDGSHKTSNPDRTWTNVGLADFGDWLRDFVRSTIPSIEAVLSCTAPVAQPLVTVDKQGHAVRVDSFLGDKQLEIGPEGLRSALLTAERERFLELPARLGNSLGPESTSLLLRIRTEKGGRRIRIAGPSDANKDSPARLEAHARAMRVLNAIPLAREWKVDGH